MQKFNRFLNKKNIVSRRKDKKIYLDYAASTPMAKEVESAMKPYVKEYFGNAGSLHYFGQKSLAALDSSREILAKALNAKFNEIVFTSGATEANNLVLRGIIKAFRINNSGYKDVMKPRIIVSAIEHASILETAKDLEKEGVEVVYLLVDKEGFVDLNQLRGSLNERTVLVSVMYANNEIGTIEPVAEISKIISDFRARISESGKSLNPALYPLFHTDAVQALQFLDVDVKNLGVDMMTISSHKIYGPKGVGALYVKGLSENNNFIASVTTGGEQEFGLRAGTENIPGIVGFAKAVELIGKNKAVEYKRIKKLRDYFFGKLKKIVPEAELNGPDMKDFRRLPNNLNIYFPNKNAEDLLIKFDMAGIAVSSGSACSVRSSAPSHVISALGFGEEYGRKSLRFTLGRPMTKKDIDKVLGRVLKLGL
jgi:cysteine desulfurase